MRGARLGGARLRGAGFRGARLRGAGLCGVVVRGAGGLGRHASLTRGSIAAYRRSTRRLARMTASEVMRTTPVMTGRSRSLIALSTAWPRPGRL
ncbi:pentapeptide repeat-containing protein [Streptomyces sp. NPDC088923]|uniref:pentapeptide repeat-containing protein n=1 Tax=Streptomyces sp. NPDC088923 TaxID=3365913 RepID=UPI0038068317